MSNTLPKGTVLSVRGEGGKFPINITLSDALHFETEHCETPEQTTNQLEISGLLNLVKKPPVLSEDAPAEDEGVIIGSKEEAPKKKKAK